VILRPTVDLLIERLVEAFDPGPSAHTAPQSGAAEEGSHLTGVGPRREE
jgi:hypothetical protein